MSKPNGLVPARFLTLVSHFIITIVIFMSKVRIDRLFIKNFVYDKIRTI